MLDTEETPAATDGQDGSQEDVQETLAAPVVDEVDSTTDSGESQEQIPDQFDWTKYNNTERFAGRNPQEVFDHLNDLEYRYGRQSNELGDARRYKTELEALRAQVSGQRPTEAKPKFSEVETAMFAQKFQEDPLSAVNEFMGPKLAETLTAQIMKQVGERLGPTLKGHAQDVADEQEVSRLFADHPDLSQDEPTLWMTKRLMGQDYLGQNVPYEQAYQLAKMSKEKASLFPETCYLMRQGVPFAKAKEYAELRQNSPAAAKTTKDQIKDEVNSISGATKRTSKKSGTKEPEIKDMDDAFDMD